MGPFHFLGHPRRKRLTGSPPTWLQIMAKPAIFKGDGDLMVDKLVTASQQSKQALQAGPVKQRELTPFFLEGCGANPGLEQINTALAVRCAFIRAWSHLSCARLGPQAGRPI